MTTFEAIVAALQEIAGDTTLPKNVRNTVTSAMTMLGTQEEPRTKANKALQHLESLSEESNVESFTRSQLYNIVSMLETVE